MKSMALPPGFDPYRQNVTLLLPNGQPFNITMNMIDQYRLYTAKLAINYGTQIGATLLLLLVLLLLTRAEKRKSSIFITNALCLVLNSVRVILSSLYLTGSIWNPYSQFAGEFSHIPQVDLGTSAAADIFTVLLIMAVMVSLGLQTWVVSVTTMPMQRWIIMGATTLIACVAIGGRIAYSAVLIKVLLERGDIGKYRYFHAFCYTSQAVAIWFFSCVFTWKLAHAIMQRRRLNMPQFGPMQIVFIMGCQTMIIPAIFSILQFRRDLPAELGTQALTLVSIFLPLSAIWAGVINEKIPATNGPDSHRQLIQSEFYRSKFGSTNASNTSKSGTEKDRQLSVCTCSPKSKGSESITATSSPRKHDSDLYEDDAIHVGREFSVRSEDARHRV